MGGWVNEGMNRDRAVAKQGQMDRWMDGQINK